jgi:hypothetical protein
MPNNSAKKQVITHTEILYEVDKSSKQSQNCLTSSDVKV